MLVRDRYLVGVLAPHPQPQPVPAKPNEEDDEETPLIVRSTRRELRDIGGTIINHCRNLLDRAGIEPAT